MKRCIFFIVIISIICLIAVPSFFTWHNTEIDNKTYGLPDLIYYSTQIIISVATLLAVLVALFGNEIKARVFKDHCKVTLVNNGFSENLGNTQNENNPTVQSYDCSLEIYNDGPNELSDLQLFLKEIYFKPDKHSDFRKIASLQNRTIFWANPDNIKTQLLVNDNKIVPIFKIYPDGSCQTPDQSTSSSLNIRIIGYRLDEKYSKKGVWQTKYQLQSNDKILATFECVVEWNGKWCNRYTEMSKCVNAELINIKIN